jgi:hypothetical protein
MNREFNKQIKRAISGLPEQSPDDKVWRGIEAQLEFREKLKDAGKRLLVHEPSEIIWQKIEANLSHANIKRFNPAAIRYLSVAASIAVIVVCSIIFFHKGKETTTESVESADNWLQPAVLTTDSLGVRAFKFIETQCKNSPYLCKAPDFDEKRQQLIEVSTELEKVNKVMATWGGSPSLFKTKTKLENLKAQLIKDIVKQVTS